MPGARLFLPQEKLDEWAAEGLVQVEGERIVLPDGSPCLDLVPAVRFTAEVTGEGDPDELVGKVKSIEQLEELGADHYRDSVLVGETAYEVIEGFAASTAPEATAEQAADPPARAAPPEPEPSSGDGEEPTDADDLARLLIEKLD